ncbi:MAG: hypothetical protein A2270_03835 [Elusimicrobia bacterium RIFOXYA12_FULL_51_18]|nr:MAG: hypothetical protein A2270_03835 [Elusimicrobia bacterium RIFOXYA12_FULL_51_18]OGS29882.1 MAG: hypothetical protein A2218_02535 [Elusimicrobia bacterium RIFOXYA2_FULL_53_38]
MSKAPEFSCTPEQIRNIADVAINELEKEINNIVGMPSPQRSFKNTVLAFEAALDRLADETEIPQFLSIVSADAEVRKAGEELKTKLGRYTVDLMTRDDIFNALNEYAEKGEKLPPLDARLLEKRLREFKRNGLGLETRKKNKVKKLRKELVGLCVEFQKNIREVTDVLEVTAEELEGLPQDYTARLKRTGNGGYLITTDFPDYIPFMENAESEDARRRLYLMFSNRCAGANVRLLEEALSLRRKVAKLLGYTSFADYVLDDRMAKNSETVFDFLKRMQAKLKVKARKELRDRIKLKENGAALSAWETAYYTNRLRKVKFDIDHQKIREYFPLETTLKGMFEVFGELLGIGIVSAELPVWHKDVRGYELRNADGSVAAYFYLDLFPRFGKYKNSLCSIVRVGRELRDGSYNLPAAAIVVNFSPPSGDIPTLLKFAEIEALFHEFGHVLQLILCRAKYSRLAPINVAWDFVEVPSTLLQQWVYESSVLRRISGHYKNPQEKLPEEVISKLISARNMVSGMYYLRLAALSMIDMRYHTACGKIDTTKLYGKLMKKVSLVGIAEGVHPQASFGHMMPSYAAGYYSYMWSEVIAADLFGVFRSSGVMNSETGGAYRRDILEPGASRGETVSVEKFLGRPVTEEAFLRSVGAA